MTQRFSIFLLALVLACDGGGARPDVEPRITIENGVTIVENAGLHMADTAALSIDTAAVVRIGVVAGAAEYMIGTLVGMLRRSDGTILIADAMAHELRLFDSTGKFLKRVGREGVGPGEYGWLTHIYPHGGDSIAVMDNEGSRASILDPALGFVRRYRPKLKETRAKPPMTSHVHEGYFSDGSLLISDFLNVCGGSRREGFCEDSVAFFRVDEEGNTLARFGSFVYSRSERRRGVVNVAFDEPHPQVIWAARGERFYYADAKRFEVKVFRLDGSLERVIRVADEAPKYDRADVFPASSGSTAPSPDAKLAEARRAMRELYDQAQLPEVFPSFSDMMVDQSGGIWLREYLPAGLMAGTQPRWFVFDVDGRLRYSLRSPPFLVRRHAPYVHMKPQLGDNFVLTSARDADGVESVVVYRLNRQAARR